MKLIFVNGMRTGEELDFAVPEITVGRELDNIVNIPVGGVSRYHGRFFRKDGKWFVEDTGSTNGIKCNRVRIHEPYALNEGDLVEFGDQMLRVSELADAAPKVNLIMLDEAPAPAAEPAPAPAPVSAPVPAPAPAPVPVPEAVPAPAENKTAVRDLSDALKNGKLHIFGGGGKKADKDSAAPEDGAAKGRHGLHFSNRMFYTIVICLMIMAVALFYNFTRISEAPAAANPAVDEARHAKHFMLYYEKNIILRDSIFYFVLHIENGKAKFQLDDLHNGRQDRQATKENLEFSTDAYERFHTILEQEKFFSVHAPEAGQGNGSERDFRRLVVCDRGQLHDVTVLNNTSPRGFEVVEQVISQFAEEYALRTISMTADELMAQAQRHFDKAEDLFMNRESRPSNLRDAIKRYRLSVEYLEAFVPKPPMWKQASTRLEEAEKIRRSRIAALKSERSRLTNLHEFAAIPPILDEIMALSDGNSPDYLDARKKRIQLDSFLRNQKGRR